MARDRGASPLRNLGERVINVVATIGDFTIFCSELAYWVTSHRPWSGTLTPSLFRIGVMSLPVVAITGMFIGMVLAVQAYNQFHMMHLESLLGSVVNASLVNELGPVLAATMLAGRVGSAMAAEIGTMRVTEQIDALWCLGAHPIHYLVAPRFLACVVMIPLLTVMADFTGILGGAAVATRILHVDAHYYWNHSEEFVNRWDVFSGLFKSIFFGAQIAVISCFRGFRATAGAEGVGRAATEAFVLSFIAILASDFFLGILLKGMYARLYGNLGVSLTG